MTTFPSVDESRQRLHRAGWSTDDELRVEDVLDDKQHRFGVAAQVAAPAACVQLDAEPALEYY